MQALILVALVTPATPQTRQIVVSIPDHKLALIENGEVKKVYSVATGRNQTPSPAGDFKVVHRVTNPTYYHRGRQVEPGPDNPVGTRWIGLMKEVTAFTAPTFPVPSAKAPPMDASAWRGATWRSSSRWCAPVTW